MLLPIVYFVLLADVIAIHLVADVIATSCYMRACFIWLMLLPCICGRCYTTKADVIAYYICIFG